VLVLQIGSIITVFLNRSKIPAGYTHEEIGFRRNYQISIPSPVSDSSLFRRIGVFFSTGENVQTMIRRW
jgi:hypothetical protein